MGAIPLGQIELIAPLACCGLPVLLAVIWLTANYNGLVRLRNTVQESWAQIDTELKRRYDLIPNLVETVKGYAAHERQVLDLVTQARARAAASVGPPASQARDENVLIGAVRQLWAVTEGYPDLKASRNFLQLQRELVNTEDRLQAARRFYNANVRDLNTRVESFPTNLIARWFGFTTADFFEVEEMVQRQPPSVTL